MPNMLRRYPLAWLFIGIAVGLVLSGVWPETPLRAVATDRIDTFAVATGPVDEDCEAVFFLDFLTGDLRAVVLSKNTGKFTSFFSYNVLQDLGIDPAKNPRFMMVTGMVNLRRGPGHAGVGRSVVYISEVTTGKVAAYALPWTPQAHLTGAKAPFIPLDVTRFRAAAGPAVGTIPGGTN